MTLEINFHTQMHTETQTERTRGQENKGKEKIERKEIRKVKEKGEREEGGKREREEGRKLLIDTLLG